MDQFDAWITENDRHLIGYAVIQKERCEIYNFVSPTFRILRFIKGITEWKIENEIDTFHAGDIVIFNNLRKRNIHRVLTGIITYEFFDFYPTLISNETLRHVFYTKTHKIVNGNGTVPERINWLLDSLREEITQKQDGFQKLSVQRLLDLLALEFHRTTEAQEPNFNTALSNITKSVQHIQMHLDDDLSLPLLAGLCGYSPEHFSRVFKKYLGISPTNYVINMRLESALHLVKSENLTILDAAYQSGFRSSSAFYKAFRAYRGTSPMEYLQSSTL